MTGGTTKDGLGLMHGEISRGILGAFYDVYNEMGPGFLEAVYQRALPVALAERGIASEREVPILVRFRGEIVGEYRADLVVERKVIVECKVTEKVLPYHEAQLLNYLKATRISVGLVLCFGARPSFRRLLLTSRENGPVVMRS